MTTITPFLFEDEHLVRTTSRADEPWFVLADVCRVLEISNPSDAARRLEDDEKATLDNIEGRPGAGAQQFTIINESGLYSLILTSRKPAAKQFKKWVTAEVLPTIRKTGGYGRDRDVSQFRAQTQAIRLMKELKRDTNPATRRVTHAMLSAILVRLGIEPPPPDAIGHDAASAPDAVAPFWDWVGALETAGTRVNHAADPALIALNLPELAEHSRRTRGPAIDTALKRALQRLDDFAGVKTVRSALRARTVKCWVFRRSALPAGR